jgi:hypothetical protein
MPVPYGEARRGEFRLRRLDPGSIPASVFRDKRSLYLC